jgi:hypothetical protein
MTCFVRDSNGSYQIPAGNVWGFALVADDGLTLPGGFGSGAESGQYVEAEEVREQFEWPTDVYPVE